MILINSAITKSPVSSVHVLPSSWDFHTAVPYCVVVVVVVVCVCVVV